MATQKRPLEKNTLKTAIYARVSTNGQKLGSQIKELKAYCSRKNWSDIVVYEEKVSGVVTNRPELAGMLGSCFRGEIGRVVVYDLSRLSRNGVSDTVTLIGELHKANVELHSVHEGLSFDGQMGLVMASMLSAFANIDYELRREKQKIGIEQAKQANNGKCHWGGSRRTRSTKNDKQIIKMKADGVSIRDIAMRLSLGVSTVQRALKAH